MKTLKLSFWATALLIFSCNESQEPAVDEKKYFSYEDGVLNFQSMEDFHHVMKVSNTSDRFLNEIVTEYPSFRSLKSEYDDFEERIKHDEDYFKDFVDKQKSRVACIIEENGEKEVARVIDNVTISSFVNHEALIIIESNAYRFFYDHVLKAAASEINSLRAAPDKSGKSSVFERLEIERDVVSYGSNERVAANDKCTNNYADKKRMVGRSSYTSLFGIFAAMNVSTKNQKKGFLGIWKADDADIIGLGFGNWDPMEGIEFLSRVRYNTNEVESGETIFCQPGIPCVINNRVATHYVKEGSVEAHCGTRP